MPVMDKTKTDVAKEFRTAEILKAASRVFGTKGFHDATVDDVAEAARIAKGTVYLYYPSKLDLYWAALKAGIVAMIEESERQVEAATTTRDKIYAFVASRVSYFEERSEFFRVYVSEFGNALRHPAEIQRDFRTLYLRQARTLAAAIAQGVGRKEIRRVRPQTAALAISDLTRGIIVQRLVGWSKAPVAEDIQFVFDLIWKGISPR